jgi:hypothetical protein
MARYIDADKLEKEIDSEKAMSFYDLLDKIHFAPTEDVRPIVRGKWIAEYDITDGHFRTYHCSTCGKLQGYLSNYCEDCGSDNKEVI